MTERKPLTFSEVNSLIAKWDTDPASVKMAQLFPGETSACISLLSSMVSLIYGKPPDFASWSSLHLYGVDDVCVAMVRLGEIWPILMHKARNEGCERVYIACLRLMYIAINVIASSGIGMSMDDVHKYLSFMCDDLSNIVKDSLDVFVEKAISGRDVTSVISAN